MKNSRFKYAYRSNASKLHRQVGDILRNSVAFKHHEIYQEYPVQRVNPNYSDARHHFDWVIPQLKIVIECHGKQHYVPTDFSGKMEPDIILETFKAQKDRDAAKKKAAQDAGFMYIKIPYSISKDLSEDWLLETIFEKSTEGVDIEINQQEEDPKIKAIKEQEKQQFRAFYSKYLKSDQYKDKLQRAREFRKRRYRELKERKDEQR